MSGGSYNYLYCKDADELLNYGSDLEQMADDLDAEFPGSLAAIRTRQLVNRIREFRTDFYSPEMESLKSVWMDMEWWKSCDSGRDRPATGVAKFEEEQLPLADPALVAIRDLLHVEELLAAPGAFLARRILGVLHPDGKKG